MAVVYIGYGRLAVLLLAYIRYWRDFTRRCLTTVVSVENVALSDA